MSLVQGAHQETSRAARVRATLLAWPEFNKPAVWLVAVILLIMPFIANGFFLIEIFGTTLILGIIALSLMFLAGYGGMVSLMQLTIAGFAGYMVAVFGMSANTNISLGWPWWLATPMALRARDHLRHARRRARGAHRGHLHHHDHARDRCGLLLFHQPELGDLQRPHRHQHRRHAEILGRRLALRHPLSITSRSASRRCAISPFNMSRARRSASRCRACATIPAAWRRSASMSTRTAWRPTPSRPLSPRSAASCRSGTTGRSRPARSASAPASIS